MIHRITSSHWLAAWCHCTICGRPPGTRRAVDARGAERFPMPTLAELDAAMLRPGRSVPAVSRLGGGTIAMAGTDQPWRVVGQSAAVYQLRQPNGRVLALRCPLTAA